MNGSKSFEALKIVFMGTPEFAVESLKAIIEAGGNVVAVVTAPDKPAGRGMQLKKTPVKLFAEEKGLHILQPEKLRAPEFISELQSLKPDLNVVVAFRMLPEIVWNLPALGSINLHGSLLPQYRGAAPINWAVINGEKQTGVTTFKLTHEIDTGHVLESEKIDIGPEETAGELHDKMMKTGAKLLVHTLKNLAAGKLTEQPQHFQDDQKHAPKIFTRDCEINWNRSAEEVNNLIRGLSPYPGAFTEFEGKKLKILKASPVESSLHLKPGEFETDQKNYLRFACAKGSIEVKSLQLEGKKLMSIEDFLRGYRFK
jgi:methionyl-tRNA formyltransferase